MYHRLEHHLLLVTILYVVSNFHAKLICIPVRSKTLPPQRWPRLTCATAPRSWIVTITPHTMHSTFVEITASFFIIGARRVEASTFVRNIFRRTVPYVKTYHAAIFFSGSFESLNVAISPVKFGGATSHLSKQICQHYFTCSFKWRTIANCTSLMNAVVCSYNS